MVPKLHAVNRYTLTCITSPYEMLGDPEMSGDLGGGAGSRGCMSSQGDVGKKAQRLQRCGKWWSSTEFPVSAATGLRDRTAGATGL